uniref:Uncharacterized protein n=1 Tax=Periophthalmus magnuspinnatus TaxID=409849 RepID=A0A3B3ZY32_9GOBI
FVTMAKRWWYRLVVVLLMLWVLSEVGEGQMSRARPQRPKKKKNPEDEEIPVPQEINIDINQVRESQWRNIMAYTMILQATAILNRLIMLNVSTESGNNPKNDIKVTILDTDYISYAILVYEVQMSKVRKTTMKLFGKSVERLHEPTLLKFETTAATRNFGLAYMFPFPTYSYCDTVDEEHIISKFDFKDLLNST